MPCMWKVPDPRHFPERTGEKYVPETLVEKTWGKGDKGLQEKGTRLVGVKGAGQQLQGTGSTIA